METRLITIQINLLNVISQAVAIMDRHIGPEIFLILQLLWLLEIVMSIKIPLKKAFNIALNHTIIVES